MTDFWINSAGPYTRWDKLYLGGKTWPGVAQVEPVANRSIDVAKRRGREPTLTDNGYNPGDVKATIRVWTEEQWSELQNLIPEFSPRKSETLTTPYEIYHPSTALLGIDAVSIKSINPKPPVEGSLFVEIQMIQWFPETSRRPRSQGRSDGGALNQSDFEVDEPDAESNL